jgi:hypothetical protein
MAGGAREQREAIRQLAELCRRLAAAEDALTDALAAMKRAEAACEDRAQAQRERYAARQEHKRASTTADRLARRVGALAERLDRAAELTSTAPRRGRRVGAARRGVAPSLPRPRRRIRAVRELSSRAGLAPPGMDKCSNRGMGVRRRPDRWPYPKRCGNGHEWGRPGRALVIWQRCPCLGAQTLYPDEAIWGHFTVSCREPGCESVFYDPPHEPVEPAAGDGNPGQAELLCGRVTRIPSGLL